MVIVYKENCNLQLYHRNHEKEAKFKILNYFNRVTTYMKRLKETAK